MRFLRHLGQKANPSVEKTDESDRSKDCDYKVTVTNLRRGMERTLCGHKCVTKSTKQQLLRTTGYKYSNAHSINNMVVPELKDVSNKKREVTS